MKQNPVFFIKKKLKELFNIFYFKNLIAEEINYNNKYFVYNLFDEFQKNSFEKNNIFFDQKYLIKTISQFLPTNYFLAVVQEHNNIIKSKSIDFFREINCLSNIVFIMPTDNLDQLISGSKGVFGSSENIVQKTIELEKKFFLIGENKSGNKDITTINNISFLKQQIENLTHNL